MSMGTTYNRNVFHRLGDAWAAFKAAPNPGMLYPPRTHSQSSTGWINWQGWEKFEKQAQAEGQKDLLRAKTSVTSPWVFADVQAIANEFSTAEMVVKQRVGDKLEDVDNHPLERIWDSPNEHMGASFVKAFWAWSYVLVGRAYLYWVPDTYGRLDEGEVWPVPPWMIRAVPDPKEFIAYYEFKASAYADTIRIPTELITYSHSVNPFDVRDGMSFLVAAMTEINADLAASQWNLNFFSDNNGVPDGMIGLSRDALDQDVERVRMELRDFFGGTQRGLAVARAGDMDYKEFGRSQKDMEFSQGREFASKVIGRTLGFPDGYWSDLANRANAEQARRTMISGAVWPLLVRLAEDMNARRRGVVQRWYGVDFRVEFKDIRPEDNDLKMRELAAYQPFLVINELRELIGKDALEDVRGLMLVAEITKGAPLPGTPAADELEAQAAAKAEEEAQKQAAMLIDSGGDMPTGEEEAPAEPPPPILGYHIEQGVVSRNEARERLSLPPEDETKSQNLRDLQAMLAVVKMATDTGIGLDVAAKLVGLDIPATPPPAPEESEAPPNPKRGVPLLEKPKRSIGEALGVPDDQGAGAVPLEAEGAPQEAPPAPDETKALRQWEAKALHDMERKGRVYRPFESSAIGAEEYARISEALADADSVEAVKAAFKRDATDTLLDSVDADARKWVEEME